MGSETLLAILTVTLPVVSAVLVAVLNNWDKINPSKRIIKELKDDVTSLKTELKEDVRDIKSDIQDHNRKFDEMAEKVDTISSAQRTSLQTHILEDCKTIQDAIDKGETDYTEELKQLIILYREYWLCGYNSQGRLYFNDTLEKASEDNSTLVHELMNLYFPEYDPNVHN